LAAADAVVARAGGSVAEVLARGVPSLLVPYPHAAGDHQSTNARMVAAQGAATAIAAPSMQTAWLQRSRRCWIPRSTGGCGRPL